MTIIKDIAGFLELMDPLYTIIILLLLIVTVLSFRLSKENIDNIIKRALWSIKRNKDLKKSFSKSVDNNILIDTALRGISDLTRSQRVSLYQYHNGGANLAGVGFAKISMTNEFCSYGIPRIIREMQNMPISIYSYWIKKIAESKDDIYEIRDIEAIEETDPSLFYYMKSFNIKSAALVAVKTFNEIPLGFIMISHSAQLHTLTERERADIIHSSGMIAGMILDSSFPKSFYSDRRYDDIRVTTKVIDKKEKPDG